MSLQNFFSVTYFVSFICDVSLRNRFWIWRYNWFEGGFGCRNNIAKDMASLINYFFQKCCPRWFGLFLRVFWNLIWSPLFSY